MTSPFDRRGGGDGNPLGFGFGREFGALVPPAERRRLRKPAPQMLLQPHAPGSVPSGPSPRGFPVELPSDEGSFDEKPLPAILRRAGVDVPAPPTHLRAERASGLVSPMRVSTAQRPVPRAEESSAWSAPAAALSDIPQHVLQSILSAVARSTEARLHAEARAREALSGEIAALEARVATLSQGFSSLRTSAVSPEALLAVQSAWRSDAATLEARVMSAVQRQLLENKRTQDSSAESPTVQSPATEVMRRMDAMRQEMEEKLERVQVSAQSRIHELSTELHAERAARIAAEDALSSRINAASRQAAVASDTRASAPARGAPSPALQGHRQRAPFDLEGYSSDDGVLEDGHDGPRLITKAAADAIATGLRTSLDAEVATRKQAIAAQEMAMRAALSQAQSDVAQALQRLETTQQQRLDAVATALSSGVAEMAERLRELAVASSTSAAKASDAHTYAHEQVGNLHEAFARLAETSQREIRQASQRWQQHEHAMADALLRGLSQEAKARDTQINDALVTVSSEVRVFVQGALSSLEQAVVRLRTEVQAVSDKANLAQAVADASNSGAKDAIQSQIESARSLAVTEVRAMRDHVAAVRDALQRQMSELKKTTAATARQATEEMMTEQATGLSTKLQEFNARWSEQAAVLENLDNVVSELSRGLSTHAATLEQHDKTLSEIVEGSVHELLTTQAAKVLELERGLKDTDLTVSQIQHSMGRHERALDACLQRVEQVQQHASRLAALEALQMNVASSLDELGTQTQLYDEKLNDCITQMQRLDVIDNRLRECSEVAASNAARHDAVQTQLTNAASGISEAAARLRACEASIETLQSSNKLDELEATMQDFHARIDTRVSDCETAIEDLQASDNLRALDVSQQTLNSKVEARLLELERVVDNVPRTERVNAIEGSVQAINGRLESELAVFRNFDVSLTEVTNGLSDHAQAIERAAAWRQEAQASLSQLRDTTVAELQQQHAAIIPKMTDMRATLDELRATVQSIMTASAARAADLDFKVQEAVAAMTKLKSSGAASSPRAETQDKSGDAGLSRKIDNLAEQTDAHSQYISILREKVTKLAHDLEAVKISAATGIDGASSPQSESGVDAGFRQKIERIVEQHTEMLGDVASQSDIQMLQESFDAALRDMQQRIDGALRHESDARLDAFEQLKLLVNAEETARNQDLDDLAGEIREHVADKCDKAFQRTATAVDQRLAAVWQKSSDIADTIEVARCVDYLVDTICDAYAPQLAAAAAERMLAGAYGDGTAPSTGRADSSLAASGLVAASSTPRLLPAESAIHSVSSHAATTLMRQSSRPRMSNGSTASGSPSARTAREYSETIAPGTP